MEITTAKYCANYRGGATNLLIYRPGYDLLLVPDYFSRKPCYIFGRDVLLSVPTVL